MGKRGKFKPCHILMRKQTVAKVRLESHWPHCVKFGIKRKGPMARTKGSE